MPDLFSIASLVSFAEFLLESDRHSFAAADVELEVVSELDLHSFTAYRADDFADQIQVQVGLRVV